MANFTVFSLGFPQKDEYVCTNPLAFKQGWRFMHEQLVSTEERLVAKHSFGILSSLYPPV